MPFRACCKFIAALVVLLSSRAFAQKATSANYGLTIFSSDGGGGHSSSLNYANDIAIGGAGVRQSAAISVVNYLGYPAQINNPPVAMPDVRSHPLNSGLDVPAAIFLQNDTDPDSDPIQLFGVESISQAGAALSLQTNHVIYTALSRFTGLDQFKYLAVDAGGDLATGTVTVAIAPAIETVPFRALAIVRLPDGRVLVRSRQDSGRTEYHLQAAEELVTRNFSTISIERVPVDGILEVILQPANRQRYFRIITF